MNPLHVSPLPVARSNFRSSVPRSIHIRSPGLHTASIQLYCRSGSLDENEREEGISHFLEHMFFRGTKEYPTPRSHLRALDKLCITANAHTSLDHTLVSMSVPKVFIREAIDHMSKMIYEPVFQGIETEKQVVIRERETEWDLEGLDTEASLIINKHLYGDTRPGRSIIGNIETVRSFTQEDLHNRIQKEFFPNNMAITVVGDVESDNVFDAIQKSFSRSVTQPSFQNLVPKYPILNKTPEDRIFIRSLTDESLADVDLFFIYPMGRPFARSMQRVLSYVLHERIFESVREQTGLAYDARCEDAYTSLHDIISLQASVQPNSITEVVRNLFSILQELIQHGVQEGEFQDAVRKALWGNICLRDSATELGDCAGYAYLFCDPIDDSHLLEGMVPENLNKFMKDIFRKENVHLRLFGEVTESDKDLCKQIFRDLFSGMYIPE